MEHMHMHLTKHAGNSVWTQLAWPPSAHAALVLMLKHHWYILTNSSNSEAVQS